MVPFRVSIHINKTKVVVFYRKGGRIHVDEKWYNEIKKLKLLMILPTLMNF